MTLTRLKMNPCKECFLEQARVQNLIEPLLMSKVFKLQNFMNDLDLSKEI